MANIMDALREIPYKVLWKFEANNLPGKPDNVMLIRWAPQQDVLRKFSSCYLMLYEGNRDDIEKSF